MIKSRLELENLLIGTGIQTFYRRTTTKDVVNFPFIVYFDTSSNNFVADNVVYKNIYQFTIILHSDIRDEENEQKIMDALTENMIPYEITNINWEEDIAMWTTTFSIQLIF